MRYFLQLSYFGAGYCGWQRQPNGLAVQEVLEEGFSQILRSPIELTGCGRTDAGVHASQYFAHMDYEGELPEELLRRINRMLPADIAVERLFLVNDDAHARFDAIRRSYQYRITFHKDPFSQNTAFWFPLWQRMDFEKLRDAAGLLLEFEEFFPFCKSNHDADTLRCRLEESAWEVDPDLRGMVFKISSNRFLRGMVRLIVGMCLNVGMGKLSLDVVRKALETQSLLARAESAPPQGLFLTEIQYPDGFRMELV